MSAVSNNERTNTTGSPFEVFRVFLRLGLTSFGGPIAHLGYFHNEAEGRCRGVYAFVPSRRSFANVREYQLNSSILECVIDKAIPNPFGASLNEYPIEGSLALSILGPLNHSCIEKECSAAQR